MGVLGKKHDDLLSADLPFKKDVNENVVIEKILGWESVSIALNETTAVGVVACLVLLSLSFSHPRALTFSLIDAVSIDKVWLTCTRTFSPGPPFLPSTARRCFSLCFLMNIGTIRI